MDNAMADTRNVNLNRLAIFAAVVETGSLTAAAARLGIAKTMVSTHMQRLETEVGANLLVRTTRRLSVTDAGQTLYEAAGEILRTAEAALDAVAGEAGPLRGTLRVGAPIDYGALVVAPALVALRDAHPALDVELICDDRRVDLVAERIDVAVRFGRLSDSNHRSVRIGGFERWVVAPPAAIARWGRPAEPAALAGWPHASLSTLQRPEFELQHGDGRRARVRCRRAFASNSMPAVHAALLAGCGFGIATSFSVEHDIAAGRLVRLLPDWSMPEADIHAIYPSTHHPSAKVRAAIDVLKARLGG
ncbi:LysR family transcriptional regulator [Burkholderia plantarii]|nr:LysR family transcriptional regulator [Burkholderia plantarii]GLZ22696.1 LysR family transcriptional regulator [Burkholderia plantarii]